MASTITPENVVLLRKKTNRSFEPGPGMLHNGRFPVVLIYKRGTQGRNKALDGMTESQARTFYTEAIAGNTDFVGVDVSRCEVKVYATERLLNRDDRDLKDASFRTSVATASTAADQAKVDHRNGKRTGATRTRHYHRSSKGLAVSDYHAGGQF